MQGKYVSKSKWGKGWPFTVPDGYVNCKDGFSATFQHGKTVYGLNGFARGYEEIRPIWRDDPDARLPGITTPLKINIGPMIDLALAQHKSNRK